MAQYTPSPEGFGKTSPPPAMYDTSTSTAESASWKGGPRNGGSGGQQQQQQQQQFYSQPKHSSSSSSKSRTKPPYTSATRGSFKSQAAMLVSNQCPSPQHPSPSRTPRNKYTANDSASDVPPSPSANYASAASQYILSQDKHRYPYRADNSNSAVTTQSEPGAPSYGNYSYYSSLTEHYSPSAAAAAAARSPEPRRLSSRFANANANQYTSDTPPTPMSAQHQHQHPASPGTPGSQYQQTQPHYQQQQQQPQPPTPNSQTANPFLSNRGRPPERGTSPNTGRPMSVSERIRKFNKNYPDPEPPELINNDNTSPPPGQEEQQQPTQPLAPFPISQPPTDYYRSTSSTGRHGTRGEAAAAAREAARLVTTTNRNNPEASSRQSRSDQVFMDDIAAHAVRERPSTSLPPVRRRKPLQQPAYNPEHEETVPPTAAMGGTQTRPAMSTGSLLRVQDLKQQLWDPEERLNVSSDQSNSSAPRRAARSLSPRQYRHSTGSSSIENTLSPNTNSIANSAGGTNVGGFKSKFYQAAMAAQRGERTITPPRQRTSNDENGGESTSPREGVPGTPPRPPVTRNAQTRGPTTMNHRSAAQEHPTPPRGTYGAGVGAGGGGGIQSMRAMPPTPPHHSHARSPSLSPQRARQAAAIEALQQPSLQQPPMDHSPLHHQSPQQEPVQQQTPPVLVQPDSHQQQQQVQSQPSHVNPMPVSQQDKQTIASLLAKLNAVSRHDPQAALAQIDNILRAESGSNPGSGDQQLLAQQALLMNAAAEGRVTPQQHQQIQQVYSQHGYPTQSLVQPSPQQQQQQQQAQAQYPPHNSMQQPPMAMEKEDIGGEGSSSDDDETSVSSMTNPTYMSSKPTHEQLHDVPPPRGLSTASYRRARPSALQGYNTPRPGPAVSGLELVQRHHQRQSIRKNRHGQPYNHHSHHHQQQLPPMINVGNPNGDGYQATAGNNYTDNLINTSARYTGNQQFPPADVHREQQHEKPQQQQQPPPHKEQSHLMEQPKTHRHEPLAMESQQSQRRQQKDDIWQKQTHSGAQDMYGFPAFEEHDARPSQSQKEERIETPRESSQPEAKLERPPTQTSQPQLQDRTEQPAGLIPRHPRDNTEKHAVSVSKPNTSRTPLDEKIGEGNGIQENQYYGTSKSSSTSKERKLDLFMSRKKKQEEEELLQLLEKHETKAQLAGGTLAAKIRTWDELSNPVSKVSTKASAEGEGRMASTGPASAAASSTDRDAASGSAPVNTSIGLMSSGAASSASKNSRRSHPWDPEGNNSKLKIDVRDTSMDNALGVEAECYSQSQASPARDLRIAARMQQQHKQQMAAADPNRSQQLQANERTLVSHISPARELRKERLARAAMQQQNEKMGFVQNETSANEVEQKSPGSHHTGIPPPQADASTNPRTDYDGDQQDTGFEVTPIYAAEQRENSGFSNEYDSDWVAMPANSFFKPSKKSPKSKIVASLVDQDTQPVTMIRSPPELPPAIADAFADVPVPYDERSNNYDPRRRSADIIDVSGYQETPPPPVPVPSEGSNRGRRAFSNFLKKRSKSQSKNNNSSVRSPSPHKRGSGVTAETSDSEGVSSRRGRRISSKSPGRDRAKSAEETGRIRNPNIRNPNIAKKFSRLLKVYGNDMNG